MPGVKEALFPSPQDAEAAFYEAFTKCDLNAMMSVWADDDDIYCVHPGGQRVSGVEKVRESWRQVFAAGRTLRFQLRDQQSVQGMILAVHSAYEYITVAGEQRPANPVIATNVYQRTGRGWRMVAHHASPAPAGGAPVGGEPAGGDPEPRRGPKTLH